MVIEGYNIGSKSQGERLERSARAIEDALRDAVGPLSIDELLSKAAARVRKTPSQMKYALVYANSEHRVQIDFSNKTVTLAKDALVLV